MKESLPPGLEIPSSETDDHYAGRDPELRIMGLVGFSPAGMARLIHLRQREIFFDPIQ